MDLPQIPVIDMGSRPMSDLAKLAPEKVRLLSAAGEALTTAPVQAWMDRRSRAWLARNVTPYKTEIDDVAAASGAGGVHALNISTEWACSSIASGPRLMRTLDWPLHGMGPALTVTRHDSAVGAWWQATWPGFVGVLTGLAPGRFAASYNQPPIRVTTGVKPLDWVVERFRVERRQAIPPTHLLRQVFETARDFDQAQQLLSDTPLAIPALFTLAGADGRSVVIERLEDRYRHRASPSAIANHWPALPGHVGTWPKGWLRGVDSAGRFRDACVWAGGLDALPADFSWLQYPILNKFSRLAAMMDCVAGTFVLMGLEQAGRSAVPATQILRLDGVKSMG
ncbi:hypothetical protein [Dongia rigui]|uniref:Uncharacterized protein n=1 Tax=Dongia rigui TaxID=940149 RepID=A0ABU5DTL6_9PROT|nr:hypothetical protein [Dongia rigui]MDY0870683.1 hypothetical protein [Dongia rigui]